MSGSECMRSKIFQTDFGGRCEYARTNCSEEVNVLNFTTFYFCQLDQTWALALVLGVFFMILCFRVISAISEEYLSIALGNISKKLKLSEALTGVTLLAYANGSPDIISSMVAGGQDDGALLSIGALYGASLFTCNFVYASVIHNTPGKGPVKLTKSLFVRDIGMFFTATTLLIILGFLGISTLIVGSILMMLYLAYVCLVGYQEYKSKGKDQEKINEGNEIYMILDETGQEDTQTEGNELSEKVLKGNLEADGEIIPQREVEEELVGEGQNKHMQGRGLAKFFTGQRHKIKEECKKGNYFDRFYFVFEYPVSVVFSLSIPPGEKDEFLWGLGLIYPFTMLYSFLLSTQQSLLLEWAFFEITLPIIVWLLPLQIIASLLVFKYTKNGDPKFPGIMMLLSAVMSVVWIYLIANLVMDILNLIQAISGFSRVFLGLTLLSLGNSLGDLFVDTALAKQGYTTMAFTGIFSGQLLNLLIGFAMNSLTSYFRDKKAGVDTNFKLFDSNLFSDKKQFLCFFVMAFSSVRLLSFIAIGFSSKFAFKKFHKYVGISVYAIFVLSFVVFEFAVFKKSPDE